MISIAEELELALAPELDEEDAAILAELFEAGGGMAHATLGDIERGRLTSTPRKYGDQGSRQQHRLRVMQKRGLVGISKGGKLSMTRRGRSAMLKRDREQAAARRGKQKLKPGEKMVFGRVVKVG